MRGPFATPWVLLVSHCTAICRLQVHIKCTCAFYAYVHIGQWHTLEVANLRENLAKNLRARRGEKTQAAFGRRAGVHQSTIQRIEMETQNVSIDTLQLLCDRLRCSASDLLEDPKDN